MPASAPAAPAASAAAAPPAAAPPLPLLERARLLLCWTARDKGYLGLGTLLYLNFLRWMAVVFFLIGCLSAPNAHLNSLGPRHPYSGFQGDFIDYASQHVSISNLGAVGWTPGANSFACSGNGFAAQACAAGAWTPGSIDAWDFPCGGAPSGAASLDDLSIIINRAKRVLYSNMVGVLCTQPVTLCRCFAGFGGADCSYPMPLVVGDPNFANGFCDPPSPWWKLTGADRTLAEAASAAERSPLFCSGRGACTTRTKVDDPSSPDFSFCMCDAGSYGAHCEKAMSGAETYGDFYNVAVRGNSTAAKDSCNQGLTPAVDRDFFIVKLPSAVCRLHGFSEMLPLNADGSLNVSNFFRVQSQGICFCEPGHAGEECLGGQPVPPEEGYITSAASIVLLLAVVALYRHRKATEQELDDFMVTPRDFTVFVNDLPAFDASSAADLARVRAHFEQFGPVEALAPAPDDENVFYFQAEKNNALSALQIARETAKAEGVARAAQGRKEAARSLAVATAASAAAARDEFAEFEAAAERLAARQRAGWRPRPPWYPRTSPLLAEEAPREAACVPLSSSALAAAEEDAPEVAAAWDARVGVVRVLAWVEAVRISLPAPALRALVRHLDRLLAEERKRPEIARFQRAFVTFRFHSDMNDALEAYSERSLARMVGAPPRRDCSNGYGCCRRAAAVAPSAASDGAPPAEVGSLDIVCSRTGEPRTVNLLFKLAEQDRFVSLSEGLASAVGRFNSTQSMDAAIARARKEAAEEAASALKAHERSATAVDEAAAAASAEAASASANPLVAPGKAPPGSGPGPAAALAQPDRSAIRVRQAWEPDEVIWDSLDTPASELALRVFLVLVYMLAFALMLFVIVTTANSEQQTGALGFLVALGVVALNTFAAAHWVLLADLEQNYSVGARMRSVYFKVLLTQVAVTVLSGTIGVYGYPFDAKNGYIQDWFRGAGGFLFRTLLIETLLPPLMVLLPIQAATNLVFERIFGTPSRVLWLQTHAPPPFVLEVRCAGLMRSVILCCAFNAGLPVLNFAAAACLLVRYVCDLHVLDSSLRLQRSGAELPRALEITLIFAGLVQAVMSWQILQAGWTNNAATEIVFVRQPARSACSGRRRASGGGSEEGASRVRNAKRHDSSSSPPPLPSPPLSNAPRPRRRPRSCCSRPSRCGESSATSRGSARARATAAAARRSALPRGWPRACPPAAARASCPSPSRPCTAPS